MDDLKILGFEIADIQRPGRVYSYPAPTSGCPMRWYVSFNEPAHGLEPGKPDARWSGLPSMFLYVDGFEAAVALAREIGEAHRRGDVSRYVLRWQQECQEARERAKGSGIS